MSSLLGFKMKRAEELLVQETLKKVREEYSNLDQISMQGKEGAYLLERINQLQGELEQIAKYMNQKW